MTAINTSAEAAFLRDIDQHETRIILDRELYRHVSFQRPNTGIMAFDLITWPSHLCFTGDMGTYIFSRTLDMFAFFRGSTPCASYDYWAEKLLAVDKHSGVTEFNHEVFCQEVKEWFDEVTEDANEWEADEPDMLWEDIEADVLRHDREWPAFEALHNYSWERSNGRVFSFQDWESRCHRYTSHYTWACHAIVWAINKYDEAKA